MRLSDIKKFTSVGDYQVDIPLSFLEKNIVWFTEDYNLDLNPDFQRGHVWTQEQQIAWLEYYFRGGVSSKVIYFNSPDFSSTVNPSRDLTGMVIVDGLQRLTALRAFLRGDIPIFGRYLNEWEGTDRSLMSYTIKFNVNNLQTREELLTWYLEMNTGGTPHSDEEIERVKGLLAECKKS